MHPHQSYSSISYAGCIQRVVFANLVYRDFGGHGILTQRPGDHAFAMPETISRCHNLIDTGANFLQLHLLFFF